jgi:glucokinase
MSLLIYLWQTFAGIRKVPLMKGHYVIAIDLGGTKVRVALVSRDGRILASVRRLSYAGNGRKLVIQNMEKAINSMLEKSGTNINNIKAISMAVAGINDVKRGIVTTAPNLPGWRGVNIRRIISEKFRLPAYLINDATAAAIGEHRLGAGQGYENLVYLTVSTGIGGGIVIGNRPYYGADGAAGELGHMKILANGPKCNCGKEGCLEALSSGSAMTGMAIEAINNGRSTIIKSLSNYDSKKITAEMIADAARQGDGLANDIISRSAYYLGIGISNLINIFNPDIIVIGGGLSGMGNMFLGPAKEVAKKTAFKLPASTVKIVKSKLGDNAGIIGAALYAFDLT